MNQTQLSKSAQIIYYVKLFWLQHWLFKQGFFIFSSSSLDFWGGLKLHVGIVLGSKQDKVLFIFSLKTFLE